MYFISTSYLYLWLLTQPIHFSTAHKFRQQQVPTYIQIYIIQYTVKRNFYINKIIFQSKIYMQSLKWNQENFYWNGARCALIALTYRIALFLLCVCVHKFIHTLRIYACKNSVCNGFACPVGHSLLNPYCYHRLCSVNPAILIVNISIAMRAPYCQCLLHFSHYSWLFFLSSISSLMTENGRGLSTRIGVVCVCAKSYILLLYCSQV